MNAYMAWPKEIQVKYIWVSGWLGYCIKLGRPLYPGA